MDRKEKCERVVLTPEEKTLLRDIKLHPHKKCSREEIWNLYELDLVKPDTSGEDDFHQPIPKDTYCVSDFYWVYHEYQHTKYRDLFLSSLWLPILVSILTNLTIDALQWLLPLILQWFSTHP